MSKFYKNSRVTIINLSTADIVDIRLTNQVAWSRPTILPANYTCNQSNTTGHIITEYYEENYLINLQIQTKKINCKIESTNK